VAGFEGEDKQLSTAVRGSMNAVVKRTTAVEVGYFRLPLDAAARRVFTRVFMRLIFFRCFRRVLRSFSRPRGIVSSGLKVCMDGPV
jgi:hypothetical protein